MSPYVLFHRAEEVVERILNAFRLKDEFTFKDLNEIVKQPEV